MDYISKKHTHDVKSFETKITIKNGKIIFSNECLLKNDTNYQTYTDIPLHSEDEMSDLDLNEYSTNEQETNNIKKIINCPKCCIL